MTIHHIYSPVTASITAFKRDPMGVINASNDAGAIAILNRNQPAFYCVTPELFAYYQALEEDLALAKIALERKQNGQFVSVTLDDL